MPLLALCAVSIDPAAPGLCNLGELRTKMENASPHPNQLSIDHWGREVKTLLRAYSSGIPFLACCGCMAFRATARFTESAEPGRAEPLPSR
jgi:hypothetical protein